MNKKLFLAFLILSSFNFLYSQTTLATGDISFVGLNSDGNDDFAFLLLRDISSGTVLYITDKGWNDGSPGSFYSADGDGILTWTSTSNLTAGTIVHIKTTNNGIMSTESFETSTGTLNPKSFPWDFTLSYTGDQLFIYQGTEANPTIIAGIHYNVEAGSTSSNWDGLANSNKTSALPNQLTNGTNAIWVYGSGPAEFDNFCYNSSVTSGTGVDIRTAANNIANWNVDQTGTTPYTINPFSPTSFTVTTPTPVELTSFTAAFVNNKIKLEWQTATEVNNYGFEIERQLTVDSSQLLEKEWTKIGFVEGHGNSNSPKVYEFIDDSVPNAKLEYRLKQIDTDGQYKLYNQTVKIDLQITDVENNAVVSTKFSLEQNYPNPFNPSTVISYQIPVNSFVQLKVFDLLGKEIITLVNREHSPGQYLATFDASDLAAGTYIYQIQTNSGFVSSKEFLLLK